MRLAPELTVEMLVFRNNLRIQSILEVGRQLAGHEDPSASLHCWTIGHLWARNVAWNDGDGRHGIGFRFRHHKSSIKFDRRLMGAGLGLAWISWRLPGSVRVSQNSGARLRL